MLFKIPPSLHLLIAVQPIQNQKRWNNYNFYFRYDTYRNFTEQEQDFHASIIPYYLQYHYPDLIHIEEKSINYPSGERLDLIYDQVYDWSDNYCIHLWSNLHRFDHSLTDINKTNTTLGQLVKFIMEPKNS